MAGVCSRVQESPGVIRQEMGCACFRYARLGQAMARLRVPHTLVLLLAMVALAWLVAWSLPPGEYERIVAADGKTRVVPGTFHFLEVAHRQPWHSILTAIPRGLSASAEIIFFVFLIGGAVAVVRETGAIDAALAVVLRARRPPPVGLGCGRHDGVHCRVEHARNG